jgi:hypothetical protein
MPVQIDHVDMDLEVVPAPAPRDQRGGNVVDELWRALRSSAFRETLTPIVVEIVAREIERARRRLG